MIELLPSAPWVRQRLLLSPSAYLDHWALRRFSTNLAEGARFTEAFKRKAGTLVLSWANMAPRLWKQHFAVNPLRSDLHSLPA